MSKGEALCGRNIIVFSIHYPRVSLPCRPVSLLQQRLLTKDECNLTIDDSECCPVCTRLKPLGSACPSVRILCYRIVPFSKPKQTKVKVSIKAPRCVSRRRQTRLADCVPWKIKKNHSFSHFINKYSNRSSPRNLKFPIENLQEKTCREQNKTEQPKSFTFETKYLNLFFYWEPTQYWCMWSLSTFLHE